MKTTTKVSLILSLAGLSAGWLASKAVTPRYIATARLAVGDSFSRSMNGIAYLRQLEEDVLDDGTLATINENPLVDIYRPERARMPVTQVAAMMRRHLVVAPEASGGSYIPFRISFTYSDPVKTQMTLSELIAKFDQWSQFRRMDLPQEERRNDDRRIARLQSRLTVLEKRLGVQPQPAPHLATPLPAFEPPPPGAAPFPGWRKTTEQFTKPVPPLDGIHLDVIDPPGRAVKIHPDIFRFLTTGLAAGLLLTGVIALFGRRSARASLMERPAQS